MALWWHGDLLSLGDMTTVENPEIPERHFKNVFHDQPAHFYIISHSHFAHCSVFSFLQITTERRTGVQPRFVSYYM